MEPPAVHTFMQGPFHFNKLQWLASIRYRSKPQVILPLQADSVHSLVLRELRHHYYLHMKMLIEEVANNSGSIQSVSSLPTTDSDWLGGEECP